MVIFRNSECELKIEKDLYSGESKLKVTPFFESYNFWHLLEMVWNGQYHSLDKEYKEREWKSLSKEQKDCINFLINYLGETDNENI